MLALFLRHVITLLSLTMVMAVAIVTTTVGDERDDGHDDVVVQRVNEGLVVEVVGSGSQSRHHLSGF